MWLIDSILVGSYNGKIFSLCLFRILFALCCLLKFFIETKRGYYKYFNPTSFIYFLYRLNCKKPQINNRIYHFLYISKIGAAFFVLLGIYVCPMLTVLALSFLFEQKMYFKFHTNLLLLICFWLSLSPCDLLLTVNDLKLAVGEFSKGELLIHFGQENDLWAQFAIIFTVSIVYIGTAIRKINPSFLSGQVLLLATQMLAQREVRQHKDTLLFTFTRFPSSLISMMMHITVLMELALPFLLIFHPLIGIDCGIVLHLLFLSLGIGTLMHFSLLMISSYLLFCDPNWVYLKVLALLNK